MNSALIFLLSRSLANFIVFRIKRLRKPKYLFSALMGGAYFYFYFFRILGSWRHLPHNASAQVSFPAFPLQTAAFLLFLFVLLFAWIFPGSRAMLAFTEAEIAFLFPAPLKRTALVGFKIIKSQIGTLFASVFFAFLSGRIFLGGAIWPRIFGWWLVLSTYQLHRLGASFALQRFRERGLSDWKRRTTLILGALAILAALVLWIQELHYAGITLTPDDPQKVFSNLQKLLETGPMLWLLSPFRIAVEPLLAQSNATFVHALWPALVLLLLHYVWVVRADVSFEEASIAFSKTRAAMIAARQRGDMRIRPASTKVREALFQLPPLGPRIVAFAWKALIQMGGKQSFRNGLVGAIVAAAFCLVVVMMPAWKAAHPIVFLVPFGAFLFLLIAPPNQATVQFRRGTELMDLLKTYPVSGWQVVGGELLSVAIRSTGLQWLCLLLAYVLLRMNALGDIPPLPLLPTLAAPLLLPGFNLLIMIVPCGAILLLPGWFKTGRGGIEASGMRLMLLIGQLLALFLVFLPAALAGFLTWLITHSMCSLETAIATAGLVAAFVLLLEGIAGVWVLGALFDRFDVTEETANA